MPARRRRRSISVAVAVLALGCVPKALFAHPGRPPEPHDAWTAWNADPWTLLALGAAALLYRRGLRNLWLRAGVGRGVRHAQALAYTAGLLTLLVALVSPVDALGSALFTAHMVQHLLLVLVAAPLIAMGAPLLVYLWALPLRGRRLLRKGFRGSAGGRRAYRALLHPLAAWTLHAIALWLWHVPKLYDAAVYSEPIHLAEHLSFFVTGLLFWWVVIPSGGALRNAPAAALIYVFTFALQSSILGALLALSTRRWYGAYIETAPTWGLTALEDQQLGGAVMWVPGGLAYLLAIALLFLRMMSMAENRAAARVTAPVVAR